MTKIITKYSSVKNIILLFGLILLFNFFIFPLSHKANKELALLDTQISYSPDEAYVILGNYSETQRENYLRGELTVDLIYPVVYTLMLCFSIFLLFGKMKIAKLPILIFIFDYAENIGIVTMIYSYPKKLITIARLTSTFTSIKWIFAFVSIVIILYGLWSKIYKIRSIRVPFIKQKNKDNSSGT